MTEINARSDSSYSYLMNTWQDSIKLAESELQTALSVLQFPEKDALTESWQQFETSLQAALIAHLDIGPIWMLNEQQMKNLADYLVANERFLECLDLAAVADRDAIRNRLLLPPQP